MEVEDVMSEILGGEPSTASVALLLIEDTYEVARLRIPCRTPRYNHLYFCKFFEKKFHKCC